MSPTATPDLSSAAWRASSYSNAQGGACLEIADAFPGIVPVRDSKDTTRTPLMFGTAAWTAFVTQVRTD